MSDVIQSERDAAVFVREERYIVFKKAHLTSAQLQQIERLTTEGPRGLPSSSHDYPMPTVECVVVESDWPEFEVVWGMIEHRVNKEKACG